MNSNEQSPTSNLYDLNEEEEEFDEELPPEAKEYYEYKNQIDIMEKILKESYYLYDDDGEDEWYDE